MIRVLIVDDHTLLRAGTKLLLELSNDIRVIGETGDGRKALDLMKSLEPDVVLMDIGMPGLNGLEVTAIAKKEIPQIKIVILSMHCSEEYILRALKVGAVGYVSKDAETCELEFAIRSAAKGGTFLSPAVSSRVIENCLAQLSDGADKSGANPYDLLTMRQREIVQLIAEGHTTKEIAEKTKLSINTVEAHRTNIKKRLKIHDVAGIVRYAISKGMIQSEQ